MTALPTKDQSRLRRQLRLVALLILAVVAASVMGNRGLLRLYQMHRAQAGLEREIQQLRSGNAALTEEVRALRTDPGRIEGIAREELGLVKPGDLVYEFQSPARPPAAPDFR